ncbi:MAG: hypothetical protein COX57_06795 [Alphaproteobacteria bacterium CG_4_10_14_0_2_um_filter_63_37]|nr:MAG: hypothetical protein AUJ55_06745 [Proteobacteria bacterium CG1_02_64_396]PJA24706.1 MAG: hypothetical protein COX57_06795 [Alphaproteobacteria bacterium CG_4_10_14_0_2_um_filter_63_37]
MRLTCPCCGACASLEGWTLDSQARGLVAAVVKADLGEGVLDYLALFRDPKGAGLDFAEATKRIDALAAVKNQGQIPRESGPVPITGALIVRGMAEVVAQARKPGAKVMRPLKTHSYLWGVVANLAEQESAAEEERQEEARRNPYRQPRASQRPQVADRLSEQELVGGFAAVRQMLQTGLKGGSNDV